MNAYMIIAIEENGKKAPVNLEFSNYNNACIMQETLETLCPALCFLVYTTDAWMYETENGRA